MVASPKSICTHPGCMTLTEGGRCLEHKAQQHKDTTKNKRGDPFYSSRAWMALRNRRRNDNPLCQECEKLGIVKAMHAVDHIKPRAAHPDLALDYANTQSLCERCHNQKTGRETIGKMKRV